MTPGRAEVSRPGSARGALLGLMVGDCLGLPREGLSPSRARRIFGDRLGHAFLFGRGMASDDTEHACMTAQALLEFPDDPTAFARSLAWKLRLWLLGLPGGVGSATLRSVVKLWCGFGPDSSGVRSAGNGPAMRAPVVGVFFDDDAALERYVSASTRLTHRDPRAERGALAVAWAARYAATTARDAFSAGELLGRLARLFPPEDAEARRWLDLVRRGLAERWEAARFGCELGCAGGVSGYMYHTLPAVFWAWLGAPFDFRATLIRVVSLGGDADTTGAIAGALCGAAGGAEAIPKEWLDGIRDYPRGVAWVGALGDRLAARREGADIGPAGLAWPWILPRNVLFMIVVLAHGVARPFLALLAGRGGRARLAKDAGLALLAAAALWPALVVAGARPAARFARERIEVTVRPRSLEVEGLYVYENRLPFPVTQGLNYPFPVDAAHPAPASAEIAEVDPATGRAVRELPALWIGGKPYFSLPVPARGAAAIRVRYAQAALDGRGTYILATTHAWRRPLDRGEYVLIPKGVRVTGSDYPLDGAGGLSFVRRDFMPDRDWKFAWQAE